MFCLHSSKVVTFNFQKENAILRYHWHFVFTGWLTGAFNFFLLLGQKETCWSKLSGHERGTGIELTEVPFRFLLN